jgi:hypothetical protein
MSHVGDVFCVLYCANIPHIVQPTTNGRYQLVGEGYLQGFMNGEVGEMESLEEHHFIIE